MTKITGKKTSLGLALILLVAANPAFAISKKLSKNQKLSVRSKHCSLQVTTETTAQIRIDCAGEKTKKNTPSSTDNVVWLKPKKFVKITSKKCFLAVQSRADKKIGVKCLNTAPTPTPSPTQTATATSTPAVTADASLLLNSNQLVGFAKATPAFPQVPLNLTGVTTGDIIVTVDRRPQNNKLYGLGYNSTNGTIRLYMISEETGTATAFPDPSAFVDEDGNTTRIGLNANTTIEMDFNPTVDRIRVVTGNGQDFRMNPNTGNVVDGDLGTGTTVTGINMDGPIKGSTSTVSGAAYLNNQASTTVSTLYTVDTFTKGVFIQNPPNEGTQTGSNILDQSPFSLVGFDIGADGVTNASNTAATAGTGHLIVQSTFGGDQKYCQFNLVTTTFGTCSQVGSYTSGILGLALNDFSGIAMIGLSLDGGSILRFKSNSVGTVVTQGTSGVTSGEVLVGMDYRPSTGQLFALGIDSAADTGTLYTLDPQTGTATVVGSASSIDLNVDFPDPATTAYGVNFNPTADRLRVTTASGLNFRVNPITGLSAANDPAINGLSAVVAGASYTNSFGGATATTLYTIDATNSAIYIQNPPNNGTQTGKVSLLLSGSPLSFSQFLGFEIQSGAKVATNSTALTAGAPRSAWAALTSGGVTGLYLIDLVSGNLTLTGTIGAGSTQLRGLVVATDNTTH